MMAPFYKYGLFGFDMSLVVAFIIGIGFGWFLERAGFGSARKLAAQFYFYDMTVFKVMFTGIITAMLGIFFLAAFGILDLTLVNMVDTYIVPQIAGGLILGFGFIIGGYCPGTSMVACSTGKLDGITFVLGVFLGTFVYGEIYPMIEPFANSTHMGKVTLMDVTNIPYGILVFAVVLMAVGGFAGATFVEKKLAAKKEVK